jgi:hypothetical protein
MSEIKNNLNMIKENYINLKDTIPEEHISSFSKVNDINLCIEISEYIDNYVKQLKRMSKLREITERCVIRNCPHLKFNREIEDDYYEEQRSEMYCVLCNSKSI